MLVFGYLIHALPTRGRKVPNSCFQGGFWIKGRKFGRNAFVLGELAFMHLGALLHLNFSCALLSMVSSPFCQWYRPLLPRLEELAILEHFISVVSSHCPCLRGPRFFSLKWSSLGFCLAFDHLLSFSFVSFLFLFSLNWLLVCVVNALIKGEIEDWSISGPVVGHSWLWWVIYNVLWTDSWLSIAGAGCGLIRVGAGEEWARKVYALRVLRGVDEGPIRRTRVGGVNGSW
jgi:hypothetical protein